MTQRLDDLSNLPAGSSEQLRLYAREVDDCASRMATEIECRVHELNGLIANMIGYCKAKGYSDGKNKWMRTKRITLGFSKAALTLRMSRHFIRSVYPKFEALLAVELAALRKEKYGAAPAGKKMEV